MAGQWKLPEMILIPEPWLDLLKRTAADLTFICKEPYALGSHTLLDLEFPIHISLFCVRKLEESAGIPLDLANQTLNVVSWPVTNARNGNHPNSQATVRKMV